jgi:hypothetical protein
MLECWRGEQVLSKGKVGAVHRHQVSGDVIQL